MKPEDLPTPQALEELLNEFKKKNADVEPQNDIDQEKDAENEEASMEEYYSSDDFKKLLDDFIDENLTPKDERVNSYLIDRSDEIQAEEITDELQEKLDSDIDEYYKVFDEDDFEEYSAPFDPDFDDFDGDEDLSDNVNDKDCDNDRDDLDSENDSDDEEDIEDNESEDIEDEDMKDTDDIDEDMDESNTESESASQSESKPSSDIDSEPKATATSARAKAVEEDEETEDKASDNDNTQEETEEDLEFQRLYESFLQDELTESKAEVEDYKRNAQQKDRDPLEELMALTGLEDVKKAVQQQLYFSRIMKMRHDAGKPVPKRLMHLLLTGNPGTGKTTVAKLIGRIYKKEGILERGHFVEANRASLVGEYIGHTEKKVLDTIEEAKGGILFIDEIYSLTERGNDGDNESTKDFGHKVIDTLMPVLDKVDSDLIVIGAGYPSKIRNFLKANPGLTSRFPTVLDFKDFTIEELKQIALDILTKYEFTPTDEFVTKLEALLKEAVKIKDHGNARMSNTIINNYVIPNLCTRMATSEQPIAHVDQTSLVIAEDLPTLEQLFPLAEKKRRMGY